MKFDIWTFLFQIVNFAVLLFILKRLLFKPVREIMEKRRRKIEGALREADNKKAEAEKLREELEEELRSRKKLRQDAEAGMRAEIDEQRRILVEAAKTEAEKTAEKERAVFETEKKKLVSDFREKAVEAVSIYAENILKDVSDEALHRSMVRKFHSKVREITPGISGIASPGEEPTLKVSTAFPLNDEETESLKKAFEASLERKISFFFETDPSLIAGISIRADDMVFDFSLWGQIRNIKAKLGKGNLWKS